MPCRCAASSFSLSPPMGEHSAAHRDFARHRDDHHERGLPVSALAMLVAIVMPAGRTIFGDGAFRYVHVNIQVP